MTYRKAVEDAGGSFAAWDAATDQPEAAGAGTTTNCPLEGVHEHPFRGPHRFHEWDPAIYEGVAVSIETDCECGGISCPGSRGRRRLAAERLREALDMERQTSEGNAMTAAGVAGFISGPWLDYIAQPYHTLTPQPEAAGEAGLREALEVLAEDHRHRMIHWYDHPEHRGTNCDLCAALLVVKRAALAAPALPEPGERT